MGQVVSYGNQNWQASQVDRVMQRRLRRKDYLPQQPLTQHPLLLRAGKLRTLWLSHGRSSERQLLSKELSPTPSKPDLEVLRSWTETWAKRLRTARFDILLKTLSEARKTWKFATAVNGAFYLQKCSQRTVHVVKKARMPFEITLKLVKATQKLNVQDQNWCRAMFTPTELECCHQNLAAHRLVVPDPASTFSMHEIFGH